MQLARYTKFTQWDTTENALPRVFYGGGKSQQSTSQVSIPPEVLAQYSNVNSIANQVAQTPFSQYSADPNAFVAPLTSSQQAGILGTNQYSNEAQPFFQNASNLNQGATAGGQNTINSALGLSSTATQAGQGYINQATGLNAGATAGGQGYIGQAAGLNTAATQAGQSGLSQAENQTTQAGTPITAAQIRQYENPYESDVINPVDALMQQQFNQAQSGQLGNAISQGAFGGDRTGITAAALQGQQALAEGNVNSGLLNQNYSQALGEANTEQQAGLQAANQYGQLSNEYGQLGQASANDLAQYGSAYGALGQAGANNLASYGSAYAGLGQANANNIANYGSAYGSLGQAGATNQANIGSGAQAAGLAGAQAQLTAGQAQQQTEQAGETALYNQFLQQQSYPFQTTQFLTNTAEGTGALSGSTTTSNQPAPFFSDERLKDDIQPIGKTFDGLNIIKFKYKGDKQTHVGLSAQDVEKKHPEAVGLAGGYKTVDYDAATEGAANKGAKGGGLVNRRMVGSLARPKLASGGLAPNSAAEAGFLLDPSYLQAQEAAYGNAPWGNAGPVTGSSPYGGKSHVPPSTGGGHAQLSVAKAPSQSNSSGLQQLSQGIAQIEGLGKTGKSLYNDAKGAMPGLGGAASTPPPQAAPLAVGTGQQGPPPPSRGQPIQANPDPNAGRASAGQLAMNDNTGLGSITDNSADFIDAKRGGRIGLDAGGTSYADAASDDESAGGDIPYDSGTGAHGLDIPDDKPNNHLATASAPGSSPNSGLGGALGTAGTIGKDILGFLALERGGRVGLAGGGSPDDIPIPPMDDAASIQQGLAPPEQGAALVRSRTMPSQAPIPVKSRPVRPQAGLNPDAPSPDAQPVQMQSPVSDMGSGSGHVTQPGEVLTQDNPGGVGDFLNRNQGLLVPALHGLAGMASSNSRYLGSAILQGLGSAADSYENTQNEMQGRTGNQPIIQQRQNEAAQTELDLYQSMITQRPELSKLSFPQFEALKASGKLNSYTGGGNSGGTGVNGGASAGPGDANGPYALTPQERLNRKLSNGNMAYADPGYNQAYTTKNSIVRSPSVQQTVIQANHDLAQSNANGFVNNPESRTTVPGFASTAVAQSQPAQQTAEANDYRTNARNYAENSGRTMSLLNEMDGIYRGYQAGPTAAWRSQAQKLIQDIDPNGTILGHTAAGEDNDKIMKDIGQLTASQLGTMSQGAPKDAHELINSFAATPDKSPGALRDLIIRGKAYTQQMNDYYNGFDPTNDQRSVFQYQKQFFSQNPYDKYRTQLEKTTPAYKGQGAAGGGGGAAPPPPPQSPQAGFVSKGYRFKGGDPSSQGSWEKVTQ